MDTPDPTSPHSVESDKPPVDQLQQLPSGSTCTRLMFRMVPPLLIASLIFMAVSGYSLLMTSRADIDREVALYADSLGEVIETLLQKGQREELKGVLSTIASDPAMLRAEIHDANGKLFAAFGDVTGPTPSLARSITGRGDHDQGQPLGRLTIHYDYKRAEKGFMEQFIGQTVRLLFIISIIFVSGYFAYQGIIGRPLRRLLKGIRDTDAEGRAVTVEWNGNDEIGRIIHAHNRLVSHLADKEAALAESEQRYRQLFDNAMVGIFDTGQDGTIRAANTTAADILGYPSAEAMMKRRIEWHYLDNKDRTRLWEKLLSKGSVSNYRTRFRRADNEIIWVNMSGRLNPDSSFSGILDDVTAQMEAQQALKERDELHRAFFEENKAVMLLHDPLTSSIQFVNPAACKFYGYTENELTSMTIRDLDRMSDEEVFEELKNAANEKRGYFKHVHTLSDGTKRFVEVFTGPVSIGSRQLHYSIVHDVTEKRRLETRLERMATRDQLTGAYNRHAFFEKGRKEITRVRRFDHQLTLLMLDLDLFKDVNDTHGHAVGDEVLRMFALRCRADLRETDIFARLGGEEFAAILVETGVELAMEAAERIRRTAAEKPIPTQAGELAVTVSIGVAALGEDETIADLLQRADKGLYAAKEAGRNRIRKS